MKVLWTHNFNPAKLNSGCFMHTAARGMSNSGIKVDLEYLGNLKNPIQILQARARVRELSRSYDLVHAQYGSACALVSSASLKPSILSIRGNDWNLHSETIGSEWLHTRLARMMTRLSLNRYHLILCASKKMCKELAKHISTKCLIKFHPSPIDLSKWPKNNRLRGEKKPPYRLLFTANDLSDPIKRYGLLKKALEIANRRLGKVELVTATRILQKDMPTVVASCDAIACTSETEGWPNSIKEALACGVPFVSTDVSDLKSIAIKATSCRIVEPNPEAFAEGICSVLTAKQDKNLRGHVEKMDIIASSKQLEKIYKTIYKKPNL